MTPDALKHAVEQIKMDEMMQARVLRRSLDHAKEFDPMKKKNRIAVIAVAAVAVMALSATAFAAVQNQVKVTWTDQSAAVNTLSEAQAAMDNAGIGLKLPETLPGGYTFKSANVSHSTMAEEKEAEGKQDIQVTEGENGMVFSFTGDIEDDGVSCTYEKDGETVLFDASKAPVDTDYADCDVVEKDGMTFYCSDGNTMAVSSVAINSDAVPEDFDPENPDLDDLDLSAIDTDTEDGTYRSVCWDVDGITYSLSQLNGELTRDQLIDMALSLSGK